MAVTIPYDPGLVLGNIVDQSQIQHLEAIATAQKPIAAAQDKLNAYILQKRSLDMTLQEMINMKVDEASLNQLAENINEVKQEMAKAAVDLSKAVITGENQIAKLKNEQPQQQIHEEVESPIDYAKSKIDKMPLSSDSLKMDVQFFRFEKNQQSADSHASAISSYVSSKTSFLFGPTIGSKVGAAAHHAATEQAQNHNIQGTLVITTNCTHKQVDVFSPFVIDVDKGIRAWNVYNASDTINTNKPEDVMKIIAEAKEAAKPGMYLLSGATYGSSFVGMVHVLHEDDSSSSQSLESMATSMVGTMEVGGWFASEEGKFGVDSDFSNSVKNLLSTSNIQSHCSLITMGIIPSIKANEVTAVVKELQGSPQENMAQLASIQGASNTDLKTVASSAGGAKDGQSLSTLSTDYLKASVDAVGKLDEQANKIIDTNSLMTAFDDYVKKAAAGDCGVPINFFLKPITKTQLAKAWINQYYPNTFKGDLTGASEDSKPS
jgi:hypothetical protein